MNAATEGLKALPLEFIDGCGLNAHQIRVRTFAAKGQPPAILFKMGSHLCDRRA